MKTKKIINRVKPKKRTVVSSRKSIVKLVKHPILRSIKIISHKHTGKLVHYKHTSHPALMLILIMTGFFMFVCAGIAEAASGSVTVGLVVQAPAPKTGAVIILPKDGSKYSDDHLIDVSGTCEPDSYVVVSDNNLVSGSTICSSDGNFSVQIQLFNGDNTISALNYDNLNQSGPVTPSVKVSLTLTNESGQGTEIIPPVVPSNPSIIPGVNSSISSCDNYSVDSSLPAGGEPHVLIICVPRLFFPKVDQVMGVLVWGGELPYELSIDWGNNLSPTRMIITAPGYYKIKFSYAVSNSYRIASILTDAKGKTAVSHSTIQVSGATSNNTNDDDEKHQSSVELSWLTESIPIYLAAVALTLGFWGGDLFERYFGAKKGHHHRKAV